MKNEYIESHRQRKEKVLDLLNKTGEYFGRHGEPEKKEVFDSLYGDVKNGAFSIVVVGEFSAGKSTLLNTLMGERYLPSFSTETTATVNYLRHKSLSRSGNEVLVMFGDGHMEEHTVASLETMRKYVSVKSEIKVAETVEYVELYLNSQFLQDGITLVDSPGLNGVAEGHKEITEQQIRKSHACIFVFSANQPGSSTDFNFLKDIKSKMNTVLFVLNRIDEVKAEEQTVEDVVSVLKSSYKKQFPDDKIPEIWPVAAYPALVYRSKEELSYNNRTGFSNEEKKRFYENSRIEAFEERLLRFITQGEKSKQELLAPAERVKSLLTQRKESFINRVKELNSATDTNDIDLEITALNNQIDKLTSTMESKREEISDRITDLIKETSEKSKSEFLKLQEKYVKQIDGWLDISDIQRNSVNFDLKIQDDYLRSANNVYQDFADEFQELSRSKYRECLLYIEAAVETMQDGISFKMSERFDFDKFDFNVGLKEYTDKKEKLQKELDDLEQKLINVQDEAVENRRLKNKKEMLEYELQEVQRRADRYNSALGKRPPVEKREFTEETKQWRGGLFGKIATLFVGKETVSKVKYENDDSLLKAYEADKEEYEKIIQSQTEDILKRYDGLQESVKEQDSYELRERSLENNKRKKESELTKLQQEQIADIKSKTEAALRQVKAELMDYIGNVERNALKQFNSEIRNKKSQFVELLHESLYKKINEEIEGKKHELETRKNQLNTSIADKNGIIEDLNSQITEINALLEETEDAIILLNTVETDFIRMDN